MAWIVAPNKQATTHFRYSEFGCRHCGKIPSLEVIRTTCEWLEKVRAALGGHVMHINSGARCVQHNKNVGGAAGSLHVAGWAADITVRNLSPKQVQSKCRKLQKEGLLGGLGCYSSFSHVDRGTKRIWTGGKPGAVPAEAVE